MADETLVDKAMSFLPGMSSPKKRAPSAASRKKQVGDIQKKLAALTRDVAKLVTLVADGSGTKTATRTKKPAGKPSQKRAAGSGTRRAAKRSAARSAKR